MGRDLDLRVGRLASSQHGVFSRKQARLLRCTDEQMDYRLETGRWTILEAGLYTVTGVPLSSESRVMAALLACGLESAASHRTAAHLWKGLSEPSGPIEILVHLDAHHYMGSGRIVRRARYLERKDVRQIGPIRVTSPARTLVDVAGVVTLNELESALDEFVGLRLISVNAVANYVADRRLEHRPGAGRLRELLEDRRNGVPQKELERRFLRLVKKYRLPPPIRQSRPGVPRSTSRIRS
jgi:hypothetical protein